MVGISAPSKSTLIAYQWLIIILYKVVYIPPGTYEVSQTILMNTDTILMGDATNASRFLKTC